MVKPDPPRAGGQPPVLIPADACNQPQRPARPAGAKDPCCDPWVQASMTYIGAEAQALAADAQRPNALIGIGKAVGAHTLPIGVSALDAATLPKKNVVCYFGSSVADADNFLVTSFEFAGLERVKGAPVPLDAFIVDINERRDRFHPLVGAMFEDDVSMKVSVENITAAPVAFHNMYAAVRDIPCVDNMEKTPILARGFGGLATFWKYVRDIWARIAG